MALGNKNQSGELVSLKPVFPKDGEGNFGVPFFEVRRKIEGKWQKQDDAVSSVSGTVTRLDIQDREWQGDDYKEVALYLRDDEVSESYVINLRFNMATRSLFNALCGLEDFDGVEVSLYKDKESGYGRYGLWQNGELVRWKFTKEEVPQPEKVKVGKKEVVDYSELDEFFEKGLVELSAKLTASPKNNTKSEENSSDEEEDDDVPF